jgi:hypothetical protein
MKKPYDFSRGIEGGRNISKKAAVRPLYITHF